MFCYSFVLHDVGTSHCGIRQIRSGETFTLVEILKKHHTYMYSLYIIYISSIIKFFMVEHH